ncbi:MAG TPA: alpha/beta hydrolase [Spirochaetota bacterium]|nr:alpha/beta hydrolase [Spirochaetota bacterium]
MIFFAGMSVAAALFLLFVIIQAFVLNTEYAEIEIVGSENLTGRFLSLSGGRTYFEIDGDETNPVVLLVHGFSVPSYMWDKTFSPLAESGFRVIRYDMYGRGLSDRPRTAYNSRLFVRQIYELLKEAGVNGKISIVGTSMGGAVAAAFARAYPHIVESIVLIDPVHEQVKIGIRRIPFIGRLVEYSFYHPGYSELQLQDFYEPDKFPDWPDRYREQMIYNGFRHAIFSTLRNFLNHDPGPYYLSIKENKIPALLIWGNEDKTLSLHGIAKLDSLISPEIFVVYKAGHLPHYERPEIVNPVIIHFLRRNTFVNVSAYI